jgi:hypothetical protein
LGFDLRGVDFFGAAGFLTAGFLAAGFLAGVATDSTMASLAFSAVGVGTGVSILYGASACSGFLAPKSLANNFNIINLLMGYLVNTNVRQLKGEQNGI